MFKTLLLPFLSGLTLKYYLLSLGVCEKRGC